MVNSVNNHFMRKIYERNMILLYINEYLIISNGGFFSFFLFNIKVFNQVKYWDRIDNDGLGSYELHYDFMTNLKIL